MTPDRSMTFLNRQNYEYNTSKKVWKQADAYVNGEYIILSQNYKMAACGKRFKCGICLQLIVESSDKKKEEDAIFCEGVCQA